MFWRRASPFLTLRASLCGTCGFLALKYTAFAAIDGNKLTENITIDGADIRDFAVGMRLPPRGQNVIRNVTLRNVVNLEIPLPVHEGRQIHLDNSELHS